MAGCFFHSRTPGCRAARLEVVEKTASPSEAVAQETLPVVAAP
jgi:hypothetical protein